MKANGKRTLGLVVKLGLLAAVGFGCVAWLAVEIGQLQGPAGQLATTYRVSAVFSDATGVVPGDEVRLAGVKVGKVGTVQVRRGRAVVALAVDRRFDLPKDARIELHWRNLLGQRYVLVVPPPDARPGGPTLAKGAVVGEERTAASADLSTLLNNTEPLLAKLDTGQINRVTETLAAAMEGREATMGQAIDGSAQLVHTLAGRADAIDASIRNLATLLDGVAGHDDEVRRLLSSLSATTGEVAAHSGDLDTALAGSDQLLAVTQKVLDANASDLDTFLGQAGTVAGTLAANKERLGEGIRTLPWTSAALLRATSHGDWLEIYGRGFGVINVFTPEARVGPDYSSVGQDDTKGPEPVLGQPRVPVPPLPGANAGAVAVNPRQSSDRPRSSGLETLLAPLGGVAR